MKTKLKRILVQISSLLMLVCALPMMLGCLNLINNAALDYEYAGAGCFGAAMVYAFSMVTGIAGLSFSKKTYRYGWCRKLAYIQTAVGIVLIIPLQSYAILALPPLFILTIFYLLALGRQEDY
jgi:TRAP-type C4-dicarboxylate transport system permease small subunit